MDAPLFHDREWETRYPPCRSVTSCVVWLLGSGAARCVSQESPVCSWLAHHEIASSVTERCNGPGLFGFCKSLFGPTLRAMYAHSSIVMLHFRGCKPVFTPFYRRLVTRSNSHSRANNPPASQNFRMYPRPCSPPCYRSRTWTLCCKSSRRRTNSFCGRGSRMQLLALRDAANQSAFRRLLLFNLAGPPSHQRQSLH